MATDESFDELISTWLQETAPAQIPARVLEDAAERTRNSRQQIGWRGLLRSIDLSRSVLALGATAAIVVAAVLALSPRIGEHEVGKLPTAGNAWSRVPIDSKWPTGQVDGLVAGPRGLVAVLGETGSHAMQLSVSTDGRTWTLAPNDQFPSDGVLWPPPGSRHLPVVVTTNGFIFVAAGNDVWASEDGSTWQRTADKARDQDLRAGSILAIAEGGPGLVAVGSDNKAWYSEDGSDWTSAEVPPPATETFEAQGASAPSVDMQGVTVAGDTLVAWGNAIATAAGDATVVEPVLWTSTDGRSWASVRDVAGIGWLQEVASGPNGFVAIGGADLDDDGGLWFSADGGTWQPAESIHDGNGTATVLFVAATGAGYVAAGSVGTCDVEPCPDAAAVIWTSPDGRTWSRLQNPDLFEVADPQGGASHSGAWATSAVTRDGHFVVGGAYDSSPAVWISSTPSATETPPVDPTPSEPSAPPSTESREAFLGVWTSTSDGDGGTQTLTVGPSADLTVDIVVTDTIATVCLGTSSTMTGTGSVEGDVLVIPAPDYRCDDGMDPQPMGGPALNEELRSLTYTRDAATDTLSVGIGDVWRRAGTEAPSPSPLPPETAAPGSSAPQPSETVAPTSPPS
jgi:hypothetical protein